ncbi:MAG: glycosyltransferase [Thermoanaerobaculia bacterium]
MKVSVAIPTYGRDEVLLETVRTLLALETRADELLVLDQTPQHVEAVERALAELDRHGDIRWLRLPRPSIPATMNRAFLEAEGDIVLFLDDDVIPSEHLVQGHRSAYQDPNVWAVVGQVLQPGEAEIDPPPTSSESCRDLEFAFNQNRGAFVENVMAGNLSVRRDRAIQVGGFDENYVTVAHRFESDFAIRVVDAGGRIWFEPSASIRHLKAPSGGTRTWGHPLTSASPAHSVGDYYFALTSVPRGKRFRYAAHRMFRSVRTRFHLRHPWWIPVKLVGEVRGLAQALLLRRRGRALLRMPR